MKDIHEQNRRSQLTQPDRDKIIKLREQGVRFKYIAESFRTSVSNVARIYRAHKKLKTTKQIHKP